jgi:hypothetical protein
MPPVAQRISPCKHMGVDFLDFLRSGEQDIHAFADSKHRWKRNSKTVTT